MFHKWSSEIQVSSFQSFLSLACMASAFFSGHKTETIAILNIPVQLVRLADDVLNAYNHMVYT
jgi:hypothetical protein